MFCKVPFFSCVIPVKGERPFFKDALASLEAQGMGEELEVIVQDGDVEPDAGQSDALNKGFAKAKGEWLFWLNADDVLLPGSLGKVRDCFNSESRNRTLRMDATRGEATEPSEASAESRRAAEGCVDWIAGNQLLVDDAGKVLKCSVGNRWHDWLYRRAVPHVYGPSSFFRRELLEKVGGFDVSLRYCMDWDLWIKFMKAGAKFFRINEYLWAQRQWTGSKTQRPLSKDEMSEHIAEVDGMCSKNGFRITRGGAWLTRAVRMLEGCYFREFADGCKWKGRTV